MPGCKNLSVGVREIDAATEGLCYLMGRLFEPLVECRRAAGYCDRTQCTRIDALLRYVDRNFQAQEHLMERVDYPHEDHHKREHWRLLHQLRRMRDANVCADRDRAVVSEVVGRWMVEHAGECDRRLGSWAVTRRVLDPCA
jgi:hemerythrin-like metal-binding protein